MTHPLKPSEADPLTDDPNLLVSTRDAAAVIPVPHLTSGRLLARNSLWNLFGQLLPMVIAVVTIPLLIRGLGVARFGVLSLAWIVIGYFSLFDMGIGRALTKLVADKIGAGEEHHIPQLAWTALLLMLLLGVFSGLITCVLSPLLVHRLLRVPPELQQETLFGFYLLALSIPMVTVTSGWRGILEAQQRFRVLNLIRIPMSTFSFVGPWLVLPFSHSLVPIISVLVVGRLVGCGAHQVACFRSLPVLGRSFVVDRRLIAPLLRIGGWMMTSNLLGPAILYLDRFLIGALLSMSAVAYYTTPFDMVSRLWVIPTSLGGVLFPAFAISMVQDPRRTGLLLSRGVKYTLLATFPPVLVIVTLSPEILRVWLGSAFAANSATVLRWLAAGILLNCVGVIPFALLQGIGRPDLTGKLLLIDLPIYLGVAWILITRFGIQGAAMAWALRAGAEFIICLLLSRRVLLKELTSLRAAWIGLGMALSILSFASLPTALVTKCLFLGVSLLSFFIVGWYLILEPEEQLFLMQGRRTLVATAGGG